MARSIFATTAIMVATFICLLVLAGCTDYGYSSDPSGTDDILAQCSQLFQFDLEGPFEVVREVPSQTDGGTINVTLQVYKVKGSEYGPGAYLVTGRVGQP